MIARPKRWSTTRRNGREAARGVALFGAGACVAWLSTYATARRRHMARDRLLKLLRRAARDSRRRTQYSAGVARGRAYRMAARLRTNGRVYDDVTLTHKVQSELFRPVDAPKSRVSVNVCDGIVELRGQVDRPETIAELGDKAAAIHGVRAVHNLLHMPGTPPPHAPVSERAEVIARATPTARQRVGMMR